MTFQVTYLEEGEEVNFDTLPVAKITHYPLEPGSYKPYAQFSYCITSEAYVFRVMAFEAVPHPKSQAVVCLYPFPEDKNKAFLITCTPDAKQGVSGGVVQGQDLRPVALESRFHEGEDLQGVYWGWDIQVPFTALAAQGHGPVYRQVGDTLPGNFYKLQTVPPVHYGSFSPVNPAHLPHQERYDREQMGQFVLVPY